MKPEMGIDDAKETLKQSIAAYKKSSQKSFSGIGKDGLERATNLVILINKTSKPTDTLDLVRSIADNPNFKKANKLKTQLTAAMLKVLGIEDKDILERAKELSAHTDTSEKAYIERAKESLLNEKIKSREILKEEGKEEGIELQDRKKEL